MAQHLCVCRHRFLFEETEKKKHACCRKVVDVVYAFYWKTIKMVTDCSRRQAHGSSIKLHAHILLIQMDLRIASLCTHFAAATISSSSIWPHACRFAHFSSFNLFYFSSFCAFNLLHISYMSCTSMQMCNGFHALSSHVLCLPYVSSACVTNTKRLRT